MPIYEFTSPRGDTYEVEGPEGSTAEEAFALISDLPTLADAIEGVESGGDTEAVSPQGATGSMQIMPATFRQYASEDRNDFKNDEHRRAAALRKLVDDWTHYGGDVEKVAAAYIGGRGAVRADGSIRDDVADAHGTTPAAYARKVLSRLPRMEPVPKERPAQVVPQEPRYRNPDRLDDAADVIAEPRYRNPDRQDAAADPVDYGSALMDMQGTPLPEPVPSKSRQQQLRDEWDEEERAIISRFRNPDRQDAVLGRPAPRANPTPVPEGTWGAPEGTWDEPASMAPTDFGAAAADMHGSPAPATPGRSYIGASAKAGALDLLGAGAKLLDSVNPFTTSAEEAAVLYKNDPQKLKEFRDSYAGALTRFTEAMSQGAEQTMQELSPEGKGLAELKYATQDPDKAAYLSGKRVIGDALRSLPTSVAMGISIYFTRGAAAEAEKAALAAGLSPEIAKQAAVRAGAQAMARVGAGTEGAAGYALHANQVVTKLQALADEKIAASPAYQRLLEQGYAPEAAREAAIQMTARETGVVAGAVDAAVNAIGGRVMGRILTEGSSVLPRVGKAAGNEALTEMAQSGGEQYGENITSQRHIKPEQELGEGVLESVVQGGVVGGVTGGAFGLFGAGPRPAAPPPAGGPTEPSAPPVDPGKPNLGPLDLRSDVEVASTVVNAGSVDEAIQQATQAVQEVPIISKPQPTAQQQEVQDMGNLILELEQLQGDTPEIPGGELPAGAELPPITPNLAPLEEQPLPTIDPGLMDSAEPTAPTGELGFQNEGVADVGRTADLPELAAGSDRLGMPDAARGLAAGLRADLPDQRPLDAGGAGDQAPGGVVPRGTQDASAALGADELEIKVDDRPVRLRLFDADGLQDDSAARTAPGPLISRSRGQELSRVGTTLEKKVVFFRAGDAKAPDGFKMKGDPNTLYINERSGITPKAVLGHEFFHTVKETDPEIHGALESVVAARMKAGKVQAEYVDRLKYKPDEVLEELTSDLGGDLIADPSFMPEVFDEIERRHGVEQARPMIAKVAQVFNSMVSKVIRAFSGQRDFKSQRMVTEMRQVRQAFRDGMASYLDARGIGRAAFEGEMVRAGRAQPAVQESKSRFVIRAKRDIDNEGEFVTVRDTTQQDATGKPLVVGHLHVPDDAISSTGWRIGDINVHKEFRRQGLARQMVEKMSQRLGSKPTGAASVFSPDGEAFFKGITEGKPPKITESKSRIEAPDTPEFKRWFAGSKVVDEAGEPLTVYHGTLADFDQFKPSTRDLGIHFGTAAAASAKKFSGKEGGNVTPVYLDMKNPLEMGDVFGPTVGNASGIVGELKRRGVIDQAETERLMKMTTQGRTGRSLDPGFYPEIIRVIENAGYDGIRYLNMAEGKRKLRPDETMDITVKPNEWLGKGSGPEKAFVAHYQGRVWGYGPSEEGARDAAIKDARRRNSPLDYSYIAFHPEQIKSAIGNRGTFDPASPKITESKPRFFSPLQRAIESVPDKIASMSGQSWRAWIDSNSAKLGAKKDEIEFSGVREYLALRGKDKVTREELASFLGENGVQVETKMLGVRHPPEELDRIAKEQFDSPFADLKDWQKQEVMDITEPLEGETKFSTYTVPGGENYREVLITLGEKKAVSAAPKIERVATTADGGVHLRVTVEGKVADVTRSANGFPFKVRYAGGESDGGFQTEMEALVGARKGLEQRTRKDLGAFRSSHWDQPNVLAHLRVDDRTDASGAKVLFVNEIQSDWGQQGKKRGFTPAGGQPEMWLVKKPGDRVSSQHDTEQEATEAMNALARAYGETPQAMGLRVGRGVDHNRLLDSTPRAPFVTDTKAWVGLAVKRAIMLAVEGGHDRVAFVNGSQAADFFDLSKQVDMIDWFVNNAGTRNVTLDVKDARRSRMEVIVDPEGVVRSSSEGGLNGKRLDEVVGKEVADKIMAEENGTLQGEGLKVGGEGMKGFYDGIVPQVVNDVLKKLGGGKVSSVPILVKIREYERTARYEGPVHTFQDVAKMHELTKSGGPDIYDNPITGNREMFAINRVANEHDLRKMMELMRQGKTFKEAITNSDVSGGAAGLFGGKIERFDAGHDTATQVGFDITPEMRAAVGKGVPLFSKARDEAQALAKPVLPYLKKDERAKLRRDTAKKMRELFQALPSAYEYAAVAWAGRAKRGWYKRSAEELVRRFGGDAPRFAALLAAMSPQTSVEDNLYNAIRVWTAWVAAGRPQGKEEILKIMGRSVQGKKGEKSVLGAWFPNTVRALTAPDPENLVISGPKVSSFMLNLRGVVDEVTNDTWMAIFADIDQTLFAGEINKGGTDPGKGPGYLAMSARVRQAAKLLTKLTGDTWTPAEVQETIWSWAKTVYEAQSAEVGARELVDNRDITDEMIGATPDFSTLFQGARYAPILRQAGLDEGGADRGDAGAAGGEQGPATQSRAGGQAAPFAQDAQLRYELAAAGRLQNVYERRAREKAAGRTPEVQLSVGRGVRGGEGLLEESRRPYQGDGREGTTLQGLPRLVEVDGQQVEFGGFKPAQDAARRYMADAGLAYDPPKTYVKVDRARAERVAAAFDAMKHDPQDPQVKAAYAQMIRETTAQYQAMLDAGITVEFIDFAKQGDPYGNPRNAILDVVENNHLWVFSTRDGFGSDASVDVSDNPLLAETEYKISGQVALANDLFRAVHDFFGHIKEGNGFRADGEENAWRSHSAMYSPLARRAMTTETRGQNSWLNFGPHGEKNRTAKTEDTVFADQKIGLLPQWAIDEGAADPAPERERDDQGRFVSQSKARTDTPAFKRWFGDSKVVDAKGEPLVVYHGTAQDISEFDPGRRPDRRSLVQKMHDLGAALGVVRSRGAFKESDLSSSIFGNRLAAVEKLYGGDLPALSAVDMRAMFFTSNAKLASEYAVAGATQTGGLKRGTAPNILPVHLAIEKPVILDFSRPSVGLVATLPDGSKHNLGDVPDIWKAANRVGMALAKKFGADGIIARSVSDSPIPKFGHLEAEMSGTKYADIYIAFRPEQIKSAIGNDGSFDPANPDITASAARTAPGAAPAAPGSRRWRDATGRTQFAPGQVLYDLLGKAANPLLVKLQLKSMSPELKRAVREMKVQVMKAQEKTSKVAAEVNVLPMAQREMVSDIIEQQLATGIVPPAQAVRVASMMNTIMGEQSNELVRLGMLSQETADRWRGKYLPRFYESKLTKSAESLWADAYRRVLGRPRVMKGISGKHLHSRGLFETIELGDLQDWQNLGWEVRDPDYDPATGTTPDGTVQVWRDFDAQERQDMGEIRDSGFRFVMGYMQTQKDIALGHMFEALAANPEVSSRTPTKDFTVPVPKSIVEGTGAKTYGKLAGRYVSAETLSHLSSIEEAQSEMLQLYRKGLGLWKEGKTALNPVSHVNNTVSNLTMAHFAGVSYWDGHKYAGAAVDLATKAAMVKEANDAGLFLGTMSDEELMNILPPALRKLARKQEGLGVKTGRIAFNIVTMYLRRPMGWMYKAEDSFFRYLIYRDARNNGLAPDEAVDYAQRYIFTYDDLPKGARRIRDFAIPFFSYTYKAAPVLLHTALTHPVRFAAPAALLWGANAVAFALAYGDEEDDWDRKLHKYLTDPGHRAKIREQEEEERKHLPPWLRGTSALFTPKAIRLGMDEVTKLPLFIDAARIIPGGDLFDVSPNSGGLPIPQPLTPSHPLFTAGVAMIGNKDLYFGKEITDSNDTVEEKTAKRAAWIWRQFAPAIAAGNYHWERTMNALAQATGQPVSWMPDALGGDATGIGRDGLPVQPKYAAMQTFGIKVRPMDLETSADIDKAMRKKMVREIDIELSRIRRLHRKGAISDRARDAAEDLAKTKKGRLKDGLTVDGKERD